MDKVFEYRFRVRLHDTDAAGVLFFGHLFRHTHDAYEAFMESIGHPIPEIIAGGDAPLPVTHAEADYLRPLRHGDAVEVAVSVLGIRRRSFEIGYSFRNIAGRQCAVARTIHVQIGVDGTGGGGLPNRLRGALADYLIGSPTD